MYTIWIYNIIEYREYRSIFYNIVFYIYQSLQVILIQYYILRIFLMLITIN